MNKIKEMNKSKMLLLYSPLFQSSEIQDAFRDLSVGPVTICTLEPH